MTAAGVIVRRHWITVVEVVVVLTLAFVVGRWTAPKPSIQSPGAVDIGFSQDMSVHHEQAVLMAGIAERRGSTAVRALASAIVVNQSEEIGLMRGWLKVWNAPAVARSPMSWMPVTTMPGMTMADVSAARDGSSMPGMASPDQLDELWKRTGKRFDILFLQLMIRHHEGGIEMSRYAAANAGVRVVRDAARSMAVQQIEDIGQMRALLAHDGGKPLPPP